MACFFVRHSPKACDGPTDRCHLIPKQRIKRELPKDAGRTIRDAIVWHPAVLVHGCRRHHGDFDGGALRLRRDQLPRRVEAYAEAFDLAWSLDADYGPRA